MESEEEEDRKLDIATTLKKLQVAEVSLICTGWRRTEDYGKPRSLINMNFSLIDDDILTEYLSTFSCSVTVRIHFI